MSGPPPARPRRLVAFDLASVAALAAALGLVGARLEAAPPTAWWPLLALAALAGVALADLGSGVVHWFCDTRFAPTTPGIGPALIAPFREHHEDPEAITRRGALEVSGYNALLGAALLVPAVPLAGRFGVGLGASLLLVGWAAAVLATVATNQIHCWAHRPRPPRVVGALQRAGLLLAPAHHARHHRDPRGVAYCVTTGWCNPLLDRSRILHRLDRAVSRARTPRDGSAGRRA
ncbi:MAG: fatty acid desaturase CarF family protein [Myxococcota bacterium]|nr:fatty acid desaturase CarF family protein [Myxococcota bacterium]